MLGKNEKQVKYEKALAKKSFVVRLFMQYIPVWFLIFVLLGILIENTDNTFLGANYVVDIFGGNPSGFGGVMLIIYMGIWSSIIPALVEMSIQKDRKRHGFSVWGDVTEDYAILDKMEEMRIEKEAKESLRINDESSVDKTDIRYWHGLLKDGIIDQEEFELKRGELL